ncbi:MAG: TrlF family AAA-like ATPase [Minisyncoccia bacterium]
MNTNFNYPKGSEWRKWDLHIHTPYTKLNNRYGTGDDVWDTFCKKIEESDVSVFGITDYFSIENYFIFIDKFKKIFSDSKKVFFPNVEFRIDSKNSENEHIQIHVLFSNEIEKARLEEFFTRLRLVSTDNIHLTNKYCTRNDLESIGYDKAMVTLENLKEQLKSDIPEDKFIIIGVANGYGSLRPGQNDGRGAEYAKEIDKICHAFFGNEDNVDFYLNKIEGRSQYNLPPKPVLKSSDCHRFDDFETKLVKQFTWIKADPTFEGLKQIIYEPEERVRIQENNPEFDFDKPTFSKILIKNPIYIFQGEKVKFNETELPLNKNLVTIIGGRGTGKSLLLNYIANTSNKTVLAYQNKEKTVKFNNSSDFEIEWQKNNNPNPETISFNAEDKGNLDFIFIEQGKLKSITSYKTLSDEIKKLLQIESLQFDEKIDADIMQLLDDIKKLKEWFEKENEKGEKVNNKEFNEKKKQEAENLLQTITTEENKEKLETYTLNIKKINDYNNWLNNLRTLKENLENYQNNTNKGIESINSEIQNEIKDLSIPNIDFKLQLDSINGIVTQLSKLLDSKKAENDTIRIKFEEQGYKGDLVTLLSNAEKYQKDIQDATNKLKEIEENEKKLKEKISQRNKLGTKLKEEYDRQKNMITDAWKNILNKFPEDKKEILKRILDDANISIDGLVIFDLNKFNEKLKDYLDLRTYKNLSQDLEINSLDDYWNFIENKLSDFIEGNKANSTKKPLDDLFFNLKERRDYLYVIPEIKYINKTLDQLSVGQRGTLYLLLQLATNAFSSPLIFDQPEDDLDNKFITNELVGLIKKLKKYRQIIISTHNANLVVTADAEQVVVANNENEGLSYSSGSLENTEIIDKVCEILEGGKAAFENRKKKYGLK